MSMQEMLDSAQEDGALHFWEPLLPGAHIRMLYVANDLYHEVLGGQRDGYRMGSLVRDFDRFCSGSQITVGTGRESTCFMKPLEPVDDEVWELRCRDPQPQVRVFGRFALPDIFVATNALYRDELGDISQTKWEGNSWPAEILRCKRKWATILPALPPYSGGSIHAYITQGAIDVDNLP